MRRTVRGWTTRVRTLMVVACVGGLPATPPTISGVPDSAEVAFDRFEVVTGAAKRQTVLAGFLFDGALADLAVLKVGENGDPRLRVYVSGNGTWAPRLEVALRPSLLFVDIANIGGRDRLVTYGAGVLNAFDPEAGTEHALLAVTSSFSPPRKGEIPHVDITRDLNADGRDDLVLPDVDGFWVLVQLSDGTFADPVKVGPSCDLTRILGADGYRYDSWSQSRIHEIDYNLDGRGDLVFWSEDQFDVHLQDEGGLFAREAKAFMTDVEFDSDDVSSLAAGDMTGRVLDSLADLNGDGIGDLVVHSLEGARTSSKHSLYEVHFGAASNGVTEFASKVGATFRSNDRIQFRMDRLDADRDGPVDLMFTTIEIKQLTGSLWKKLKGFMGDDVRLDLEFYRADDGVYPDEPSATHRIALDGVPSHREPGWVPLDVVLRGGKHESRKTEKRWPRAFNRTLLIGDVTGDGRSDLLFEAEFRDLLVIVGVPGPDLFAGQPQKVSVALFDEEYTWLVDLNRDGKQDILMHQPFTLRTPHGAPKLPPGSEPNRVTMLIAR